DAGDDGEAAGVGFGDAGELGVAEVAVAEFAGVDPAVADVFVADGDLAFEAIRGVDDLPGVAAVGVHGDDADELEWARRADAGLFVEFAHGRDFGSFAFID